MERKKAQVSDTTGLNKSLLLATKKELKQRV